MAALEKQLLDAVWATPGEAMSALAPRIGVSPSTLQVPVARLKAAGRLKTVGARQFTRYFPTERGGESSAGIGG
jgi:DNA-binding Lrp family transcriptional regulator